MILVRVSVCAAFAAVLLATTASAATITFESGTGTEAGFVVSGAADRFGFLGSGLHSQNGTIALWTQGSAVTLRRDDGGAFDLLGFDGAEYFDVAFGAEWQYDSSSIEATGAGPGGTTSVSFALDGVADGTGGAPDFQTFAVGFFGVTEVRFEGDGFYGHHFALDNIVVAAADPVPEPASLLLLGSGLAGLAYRRARRRV